MTDETLTITAGTREYRRLLRTLPWYAVGLVLAAGAVWWKSDGDVRGTLWASAGTVLVVGGILGYVLWLRHQQRHWSIEVTSAELVITRRRRVTVSRGGLAAALVGYLTTSRNVLDPEMDTRQLVLVRSDGSLVDAITARDWPEGTWERLTSALGLEVSPLTKDARRRLQPAWARHGVLIGIGGTIAFFGLLALGLWLATR